MQKIAWILGAADPEMEEIERILVESGQDVHHATDRGRRVHPGNAYRADGPVLSVDLYQKFILVECDFVPALIPAYQVVYGCHRCGDLLNPTTGLGLRDADHPGGMGVCGDNHLWPEVTHVDHHKMGDPGYGCPPRRILRGFFVGAGG